MINAITESLRGSPYVLQEGTGREILSAAQKLAEDVELLRQNGSLDDEVLSELRKEWGVKQVYESAGIEGNELTLNETLLAIQRGVTISGKPPGQSDEVRNLNMALHFLEELFREAKPLGEWEIREVQKLVLGINDPNGGRYRDIEVAISNSPHKPPHPIRVPEMMRDFASWFKQATFVPIPLQAAVAHAWLVHIHPFSDGNGRTARAIMNLLLMRHGFPVIVVRKKDRQRYYEALRDSDDGDIGPFLELILARSGDSMAQIDRIRQAKTGITLAIQRVHDAEERRFRVWQDGIALLLSTLEEAFRSIKSGDATFEIFGNRYDLPGFEDYRAICERDSRANSWLMKITLVHNAQTRSVLFWMGFASDALLRGTGARDPFPGVKIAMRNPAGYPQWSPCDETFPSSVNEFAYYDGRFFSVDQKGNVHVEDTVVSLAHHFAADLVEGWFA